MGASSTAKRRRREARLNKGRKMSKAEKLEHRIRAQRKREGR